MTAYKECNITLETIEEAFCSCLENDGLRAGICCSSMAQMGELRTMVVQIKDDMPPWSIERIITSQYSISVNFHNGSNLYLFTGNHHSRGRRFHYLSVEEDIDDAIKTTVLRRLMREYQSQDNNADMDIIKFAEDKLNTHLLDWQKEMLRGLASGGVYIAGRNYGKQQMIDIYKSWVSNKTEGERCECEYTYDEIMAGIPAKQPNQTVI